MDRDRGERRVRHGVVAEVGEGVRPLEVRRRRVDDLAILGKRPDVALRGTVDRHEHRVDRRGRGRVGTDAEVRVGAVQLNRRELVHADVDRLVVARRREVGGPVGVAVEVRCHVHAGERLRIVAVGVPRAEFAGPERAERVEHPCPIR